MTTEEAFVSAIDLAVEQSAALAAAMREAVQEAEKAQALGLQIPASQQASKAHLQHVLEAGGLPALLAQLRRITSECKVLQEQLKAQRLHQHMARLASLRPGIERAHGRLSKIEAILAPAREDRLERDLDELRVR